MPIVYRFETSEGVGVYRFKHCYWVTEKYTGERHPGPSRDGRLGNAWLTLRSKGTAEAYSFGFSSKASLKRWFYCKADRKTLSEQGIICSIYEVDKADFIRGTAQAVFRKLRAKKIGELPIDQWV